MTGYLTDYSGKKYTLPTLLSWSVTHGLGSPCDCYEVVCRYDPEMEPWLKKAYRFTAVHEGKTVFYGVVDETQAEIMRDGRLFSISAGASRRCSWTMRPRPPSITPAPSGIFWTDMSTPGASGTCRISRWDISTISTWTAVKASGRYCPASLHLRRGSHRDLPVRGSWSYPMPRERATPLTGQRLSISSGRSGDTA